MIDGCYNRAPITGQHAPLTLCRQASKLFRTKVCQKGLIRGLFASVLLAMLVPAHATEKALVMTGQAPEAIDQLGSPVMAPITLPSDTSDGLVKFSSLSPVVLAYLATQETGAQGAFKPNLRQLRIVDSQGQVMPMALRLVKNIEKTSQSLPIVSVAQDNPVAVEKLRQAVLLAVNNANDANAISIELKSFPRNPVFATDTPSGQGPVSWWLANPRASAPDTSGMPAEDLGASQLALSFAKPQDNRLLQVQLYGSEDLQSWQLLTQTVVRPFGTAADRGASTPSLTDTTLDSRSQSNRVSQRFELSPAQSRYRYWQVVANQPVLFQGATLEQPREQPRYFLTRANFIRDTNTANQWQLRLPQPMYTMGMTFFVPQNQLWQISLSATADERMQLSQLLRQPIPTVTSAKPLVQQSQVDYQNSLVQWQPNIMQQVNLLGQLPADNLPVTLLTPVYELLFLAQGTPPYEMRINEPQSLAKPPVILSGQQISQLAEAGEGQLGVLQLVDDPDASQQQYKQWLLWSVLLLILVMLGAMAYRLYQQTTTQRPSQ